jgi:hypothetical protein
LEGEGQGRHLRGGRWTRWSEAAAASSATRRGDERRRLVGWSSLGVSFRWLVSIWSLQGNCRNQRRSSKEESRSRWDSDPKDKDEEQMPLQPRLDWPLFFGNLCWALACVQCFPLYNCSLQVQVYAGAWGMCCCFSGARPAR